MGALTYEFVFVGPPIGFALLGTTGLPIDGTSPLISTVVTVVATTATAAVGYLAYRVSEGRWSDGTGVRVDQGDTRQLLAVGFGTTAILAAVPSLAGEGFVLSLPYVTLVIVALGVLHVQTGGRLRVETYRSPTGQERRRLQDCFAAFDATPGTVVIGSSEEGETPASPAVYVTSAFGHRVTYVREEFLDIATDDELSVALAEATYRGPLTTVLDTVLNTTARMIIISFLLAIVNAITTWTLDIGLDALHAPPLVLVVVVGGLFIYVQVYHGLSHWSYYAADEFASHHLGTDTVRRTYRALGEWLASEVEFENPETQMTDDPSLVQRLDRLGGTRTETTQFAALTGWITAIGVAGCLWVANTWARPVEVIAAGTQTPDIALGIASACVGLALAAVPLAAVYVRHGSLLESLPDASRSMLNTRPELPVVIIFSLLATDLVIGSHVPFVWLALGVTGLLATGLAYHHTYDTFSFVETGQPPSPAEADRIRSCVHNIYTQPDRIRIYDSLDASDIYVAGDRNDRTVHVARPLLEELSDSELEVVLSVGYERARHITPAGRLDYAVDGLFVVMAVYGLSIIVAATNLGGAILLGAILLLLVISFYNRRVIARFFRIDERLCDRYGSALVRVTYQKMGSGLHTIYGRGPDKLKLIWRLGILYVPPLSVRLDRLPEPRQESHPDGSVHDAERSY